MSSSLRQQIDPLLEYLQHDSWRCGHAPHYHLPHSGREMFDRGDCPCGLMKALRDAGIDPAPWMPQPTCTQESSR